MNKRVAYKQQGNSAKKFLGKLQKKKMCYVIKADS
jgi:hypothetical protein